MPYDFAPWPLPDDPARLNLPKRRATLWIFVHVTANTPEASVSPASLAALHRKPKSAGGLGAATVGYHELVKRSGALMACRPAELTGAAVLGWNSKAYHIALEGGLDAEGRPYQRVEDFPPEQIAALARRLGELAADYPGAAILGHRDVSPDLDGDGVIERHEWIKECPCFDVIPWAAGLGLPVAQINSGWRADDPRRPAAPDRVETALQEALEALGHDPGPIDGVLGPRTRAALRRFQGAQGLDITGVADPATRQALRRLTRGPEPEPVLEAPRAKEAAGAWPLLLFAWGAVMGLPWPALLSLLAVGALGVALLYRAARRDAAERAAAGDPLAGPPPDMGDWLLAKARGFALWLASLRGALGAPDVAMRGAAGEG